LASGIEFLVEKSPHVPSVLTVSHIAITHRGKPKCLRFLFSGHRTLDLRCRFTRWSK